MAIIQTTQSLGFISFSLRVLSIISSLSLLEAQNGGFSVDLIHRDSPKSPFYNLSETPYGRLNNALRRSISRANHFNPTTFSPTAGLSQVINGNGEYLMSVSIGMPPFEILAIVDTGSDLTWTQCKPCTQCFEQKAPLFDPKRTSTYKEIPCNSRPCSSLIGTCPSQGKACQYSMSYADGSYSTGVLSADIITLGTSSGRPVSLSKTIFGCGYNNNMHFNVNGSTGIVGFGGGTSSIVSQMNSLIDGKFSYCLVSIYETKPGKMNFGSEGTVSGPGVVSTPIVSTPQGTFYYLTLEAISVGHKKLASGGKIIIDSGTTLTLLPSDLYYQLQSEVSKAIRSERIEDPDKILKLCYRTELDINAPTITVHFAEADVKLNSLNSFVRIANDIVCFAFLPSQNGAIYGNLAQMNFLVGYDLKNRTVSFKPTDCTKM